MTQCYDNPHVIINGEYAAEPCALVVSGDDLTDPVLDAGYHGPFTSTREAQKYARAFRERHGIPGHANVEPTAEENEAWTAAGWTFGIFALERED